MNRMFVCNLQLACESPTLYHVVAYPPTYEEIKQMPGIDCKDPKVFINDCWYLTPTGHPPKMFLANSEKNDVDENATTLSYENHSSIPFWFNHNGKYYGEVKITGQLVRGSIIQLPNKENADGEFCIELFDGRFDDIDNNIYPDDDPNWQKAFTEKQRLVTRLGLNNNLNLYTNNEIKHGHLEMHFKPF